MFMDELETLKVKIAQLEKENETLKASNGHSAEQDDYNESQIRFRTVFECSRLGNKIINSDLVILQINPAMVALLGYDRKEEIVGAKIMDYTPHQSFRMTGECFRIIYGTKTLHLLAWKHV